MNDNLVIRMVQCSSIRLHITLESKELQTDTQSIKFQCQVLYPANYILN
jgi:hypothetical protein